jgi:hypothetical protein
MEKLVYLVYDRPSRPPSDVRAQWIDDVAPRLLAAGARRLQIDLDDDEAQVPSLVPVPDDELPLRAEVSMWVDAHDFRAPLEEILSDVGIRRAGYLVTESMYRDYGDNEHMRKRDWADGVRSPGIVTVTTFDKPANVDDATFYGHWFGHQSPMSEWMQPRARYVRNAVVRPLTPGAPPLRAIVEEAWADAAILGDLPRFFGVGPDDDLGERIRIMLDSTKRLAAPETLRVYTMSEWIIRS